MTRWWLACAGAGLATVIAVQPDLRAARPITFADVTRQAGVSFVQNTGAFGAKYMPEQLGAGAIFFDCDGNGTQDLLLVNGTNWPGRPGPATTSRLYRNAGNGTFTDVTAGSGLDVPLYGVGGAAGDWDGDGRVDLYLTALGGGRLFRNLGGGRFQDVTHAAGVADQGWGTSALWLDYDKDGWLDLFVARYVVWDIASDVTCMSTAKRKSYCSPSMYRPTSPRLFRNRGNGTFEDATERAGLATPVSSGLGVAMLDYDADGWTDLFLANDLRPNQLFRNRGDGTFADAARRAGVAVSELGVARAGMGVDAADYDGSGRPSLVIGNFANEMMALYRNAGRGLFLDEAPRSAIGKSTLLSLTFACFFFDYDLDGWLDIFSANGHIDEAVVEFDPRVRFRQPPHLFRNLGGKSFEDQRTRVGPDLARPLVGRGAAHADIDNDGDLDLVITEMGGAARLLRNDGGNQNHSVRVRAVSKGPNTQAIGTRVDIVSSAGRRAVQVIRTGSSFASQSQTAVTFGLGAEKGLSALRVTWPSGKTENLGGQSAGVEIVVTEGQGVTARLPFRRGG